MSDKFWACMYEYVQLNSTIIAYIADISSNSALLSDAAIAYLSIDAKLQAMTIDSFPNLLSSNVDLAILIRCWVERMSKRMTDEHFAALFLDARKHVRDFVQSEPALVGSVQLADYGSTNAITRAVRVIKKFATADVPDDDKVVKVCLFSSASLHLVQRRFEVEQLLTCCKDSVTKAHDIKHNLLRSVSH
jgi:hypothetical protein